MTKELIKAGKFSFNIDLSWYEKDLHGFWEELVKASIAWIKMEFTGASRFSDWVFQHKNYYNDPHKLDYHYLRFESEGIIFKTYRKEIADKKHGEILIEINESGEAASISRDLEGTIDLLKKCGRDRAINYWAN